MFAEKPPKKATKKTYKRYQLLRAYPDVQWKVHELLDLKEEALDSGLEWWSPPSIKGSTDLLVPPDLLADIKDHLKSLKIDFDVIIWDLQVSCDIPSCAKKNTASINTWVRKQCTFDSLATSVTMQ